MKKYLLTAVAIGLIPNTASAAELLVNGGFELPEVDGPCCITSPPTAIPGWQATPNVNVVNGTFSSSPSGTNLAYEGNQYLDLIGEGGFGTISQGFDTVVGKMYTLTFAYSHNLFGGLDSASANFTVGGGVDLDASITHSTGSSSDLDWQVFSSNFIASNSNSILTFNNTSGNTNEGIFLDAVSVSAVPEPATWGLMILGFGAIGGAMRRRNHKTTVAYA